VLPEQHSLYTLLDVLVGCMCRGCAAAAPGSVSVPEASCQTAPQPGIRWVWVLRGRCRTRPAQSPPNSQS